jgi:hypothetical protein
VLSVGFGVELCQCNRVSLLGLVSRHQLIFEVLSELAHLAVVNDQQRQSCQIWKVLPSELIPEEATLQAQQSAPAQVARQVKSSSHPMQLVHSKISTPNLKQLSSRKSNGL